MFLPECCNKCGCSCSFLPHTVTLAFSGFDSKMAFGVANGSASSCKGDFGSGATVGISSPGGTVDDIGPVLEAFVINPGSCYAEPGRVAPTLSVSQSSISQKAEFSVEIEEFESKCRPAWKVSSITVKNGEDLADGSTIGIAWEVGDTRVVDSTAKISQGDETTSVKIVAAGEFFRQATADRDIPIIAASADGGVRLKPTTTLNRNPPYTWSVSGLSVLYAGDGLAGDKATVTFSEGDRTNVVDGDAAEAFLTVEDGKAVSATVSNPGTYYRDTDVAPVVADVKFFPAGRVRPSDPLPAGAVLSGVVDDDPASKTFGQVIGVEVDDGGENYRGWAWTPSRCITELNDRSIVLRANQWTPLTRTCPSGCFGSGASVEPILRVKPLMVGKIDGVSVANVYLEENEGAPGTWGVSRVEGFAGPIFEVGQKIAVAFESPVPANPSDFYLLPAPVPMRTKEELAAVVTVAEVELLPEEVDVYPPDWPSGHLKSVTIEEPGRYYKESNVWDGVETPIHHVRLMNRGAEYAKKGRVEPTVTAGDSGEMAVTLAESADGCDLPIWEIESISPSGSGYTDSTRLTISTDAEVELAARVVVHTREEPTVNVSAVGGTSTLAVTLKKNGPSVSGWSEIFDLPTNAVGATWSVESIEVANAGGGYPPNSTVQLSFSTPHVANSHAAGVAVTGESGEVLSASLTKAGSYFRNQGIPQEFTIVRRGAYYEESDELPPYIGLNEITVVQTLPSEGSGAVIKATVDDDPASDGFGQIDSVEVEEPGQDYLLYSGPSDCLYRYFCPTTSTVLDAVVGRGEIVITTSRLTIPSEEGGIPQDERENIYDWAGRFVSDETVDDCSALPTAKYKSSYTGVSGEITIEAGGALDLKDPCCGCPCSLSDYPLDLAVPCGIASVLVEVDIQVEPDEEDPSRCGNVNQSFELTPLYINSASTTRGNWSSAVFGVDGWNINALLECGAGEGASYMVGVAAGPEFFGSCSIAPGEGEPNSLQLSVPLPSARDATGERCCPTEGAEAEVTVGAATMTVSVTIVEAGE